MSKEKKSTLGPLGRMIGQFPLAFAKAVVLGERPTNRQGGKINNGTAALLRLDCGPVAVTCHHVVRRYRERREAGEQCLFWVGECRIDPLSQCIADSEEADLAVLGLTERQEQKMTGAGSIGAQFFVPIFWPPKQVASGEDVVFCGFPGQWRAHLDFNFLEFASYSQGSRVSDVSHNSFICECRREFWMSESGLRDVNSLADFGGISGGPAFVWRDLHWDFAGVVREHLPQSDAVRIALAGLIRSDGTINAAL